MNQQQKHARAAAQHLAVAAATLAQRFPVDPRAAEAARTLDVYAEQLRQEATDQ